MTTMSSKYMAGSSGVGSSSSRSEPRMWNYAVPTGEEDESSSPPEHGSAPISQRQPITYGSENAGRNKYRANNTKPTRLNQQTSQPNLQRAFQPDANDAFQGSTEPDTLMDPYKYDSRSRGPSKERQKVKRKNSKASALQGSDDVPKVKEEDKWIHRDKLAAIESREMAEMSVRIGKGSRNGSRAAKSRKASSVMSEGVPDDVANASLGDEQYVHDDKRLRTMSPQMDVQEEEYDEDITMETIEQQAEGMPYRTQSGQDLTRPTTSSRIPISKSPPTSVGPSAEPSSPTSPVRGNRSGSYSKHRARSGSSVGQNILDANGTYDPTGQQMTPFDSTDDNLQNPQRSPPKTRSTKPTASRKTSAARNASGQKPKQSPGDSPRPGTSGGSRPTTARPEGEPPWIATMFKPDPRLPPDQQMLPTHAKRLAMQREMEKENRAPIDQEQSEYTLLDAEDSPPENPIDTESPNLRQTSSSPQRLASHPSNDPYLQKPTGYRTKNPGLAIGVNGDEDGSSDSAQWPLKSPSPRPNPSPDENSLWEKPRTSSGSYNLMPTVKSPMYSPNNPESRFPRSELESKANVNSPLAVDTKPTVTTVPETKEEDEEGKKKKKGCGGCCIVM